MSSKRPDILLLHDPRLDLPSNEALSQAARLRATHPQAPPLITAGILYLSLIDREDIKSLGQSIGVDNQEIARWAYNINIFANFEPYAHRHWQSEVWDQHVDRAIDAAFADANKAGIETAPPGILLRQIIRTDPIQDIVAGRGIERKLDRLGDDAYKVATERRNTYLYRAG
jgi:hypothetical protein